jgi:hypothetical protein
LSLPLILQTAAQAEFDDAFDWYEAQRPGLGVTFAARINECSAGSPKILITIR